MGLGLITNIIIVRKLTISDFGVFSVTSMVIGLITTFGFSWSSSSILYYGSKEKEQYGTLNKTFWARNIIIFISLLITTVFFIIFKKEINAYIGLDVAFLVLIWLYISVAEDYLNQYFLAVKRQITSTMLSITAKILYIILILILSFDVKTLIFLNIISHATVIFYVLGMNKKDIGKFEFDYNWFKEVLNFSLWQLFGYSGLYLINFGDTAVIKYYMTAEDVGVYNAAYKLFNAVAAFSSVISSYYASNVMHYFSNNNQKKLSEFYNKERWIIVALSTIMHVVVIIFSKPIILTFYGERYIDSVSIFSILMVGSMVRYVAVFYTLYYNSNGKHKILQYVNIVRAILNLIFDIIFIKIFGLIGPAIATTVAIILTFIFSYYYCETKIRHLIKRGD
jgi:O-antigen/teichoic acid export membrane protein